MNRPIRRVAFVAMIMFALLLRQRDLHGAVPAGLARRRPAEPAGPRRRVRPGPRLDPGRGQDRDRRPRSRSRTGSSSSGPIPRVSCTRRSPASTPTTTPVRGWRARYNTQLAGTDDSLFVRRLIDLITNRTPQGASVQTTIEPKVAGGRRQGAGQPEGRGGGARPEDRRDAGHGDQPQLRPERHRQPRHRRRPSKAYSELANDSDRPLSNRAVREIYPPGSTFKLVTAAAALEDGQTPDSKVAVAGPAAAAQHQHLPGQRHQLRRHRDHHHAGAGGVLQHRVRQPRPRARRRTSCGRRRRSSASTSGTWPTSAASASQFPDDLDAAQTRAQRDRPVRRRGQPAADGDGDGGDRQRRGADGPVPGRQVQAPDLKPLETAQARRSCPGHDAGERQGLKQMMVGVVDQRHRPATRQIAGVEVGGKTGTAQSDPKRKPFAWFTSFAPVGRPAGGRGRDDRGRRHPAQRHRRRPAWPRRSPEAVMEAAL